MTEPVMSYREFEDAAAGLVEREGLDVETFQAMFQIFRLSGLMFNRLESQVHKPAGWSLAGFRVMFILWVAGDLEPRDIARLAGLSRAAISSALNTLERDGFVERRRESADRRLVTVSLTAHGRREVAEAYTAQNELESTLFSSLTDEELTVMTTLMRRLSSSARTGDSGASS